MKPAEPLDRPEPPTESPFKGKRGLARVVDAFFHSCRGLADAFRNESAFRQEVALAAILLPSALALPASPVERALLVASVLVVLVAELLNTGVEAAIDRISFERHSLSRRAKDIGSAAVFVALVNLVVVWMLIAAPLLASAGGGS